LLVPIAFLIIDGDVGIFAWPTAATSVILGLFAWWLYEVDGAEHSLLRGMVASICMGATVYAITFPALPALFPSELVREAVAANHCPQPRLASTYSYQEPSLVFLLGTETHFTDGTGAAEFMHKGGCRFALVGPRSEVSFIQRANVLGLRYALDRRIDGFNISIGRPMAMTLFRTMAK
jgi:hypothetical protein